jgi:IQ calmodulin-binding motif
MKRLNLIVKVQSLVRRWFAFKTTKQMIFTRQREKDVALMELERLEKIRIESIICVQSIVRRFLAIRVRRRALDTQQTKIPTLSGVKRSGSLMKPRVSKIAKCDSSVDQCVDQVMEIAESSAPVGDVIMETPITETPLMIEIPKVVSTANIRTSTRKQRDRQ